MPPQSILASDAGESRPQLALAAPRQPLQPISANTGTRLPPAAPVKKKPGPKPKSLIDRKVVEKPVKRQQRSYSRERKLQVLTFLLHHKMIQTRQRQQRRRDDLLSFHTSTEDMVGPSRYGLMPKAELVRLCRHYRLKVSGNKASLIERLRAREEQADQGQH
ncbi:predicted protein [Chaetomium globosum CBS 148.51]|uniref:SAP domain-containing protein n=1 Tax=Chaetomium globosum (strain ATCC 6205 / CBS 148.51 / DSM 1962 / NBRC 6347 / NRRL 1970) TaxID=306901 RepID=Q2GNF6_CHAGB|nr:uncharacterized protein CHGG_10498 [Chaetomium globosum CBS 148.51]EAQ84094.1 predicted protein [Chaetomium globosum CBS 148.51]